MRLRASLRISTTPGALVVRAGGGDLPHGQRQLAHRRAQLAVHAPAATGELPRGAARLGHALGGLGGTRLGQLERALALALGAADQTFVLQHLQRRVDRAGARTPGAFALLLEALDQVVAVPRAVLEHHQQRGADVTRDACGRPAGPTAARPGPRRASPGPFSGRVGHAGLVRPSRTC